MPRMLSCLMMMMMVSTVEETEDWKRFDIPQQV
jgi:hypothetical protein